MAFSSRSISSPLGTGSAGAPYGTPRRAPNFVPLSVFFLQLTGEDGEEDERPKVKGFRVKADGEDDKNKPLGPIHFDNAEKGVTRGAKGPRPKARPKKPIGNDVEEGMTTTANVPTPAKPIGRPIRRLEPKRKKQWMEGLTRLMGQ